jgi:adenylyltransferase/sulfurtransferase
VSEPTFTEEQVLRYARHIILPEIGGQGQARLMESSVLVVGAGGLGSPAAMYLAAAGVGRIGLVDFDHVDATNLQRQLLHDTDDVGRPKVESATERLHDLNPNVEVVPHDVALSSANAMDILRGFDVVVDGTDNFPVRYLVNDATQMLGTPLVYGSIYQFEGQASVFLPGRGTPCYRCLFPQPPPPGAVPSCAEAGVFGVLPGIIGSIQAVEAIKLLLDMGEPLASRLLLFDALAMSFRTVNLRWDPECPVCGDRPTVTELIDYEAFCGLAPGQAPPEAEHAPAIGE